MRNLSAIFLIIAVLSACKNTEVKQFCEPVIKRQYNIVYNAHFDGSFTVQPPCADTAFVLRTEIPTDTVLPGNVKTYSIPKGIQYLVVSPCALDSVLTYTYNNTCP